MKLLQSKSKNSTSLYVAKSTYENGKHSSKIVEKLGTVADLQKKLGGEDPIEWAKKYIAELTRQEKEQSRKVIVEYSPVRTIAKDQQHLWNGGYLFLQQIYYSLGLKEICKAISMRHKFTFDLNEILSKLIYARILFHASKHATHQLCEGFIEPPQFKLQHIYRALEVIAAEGEYIQSEIYRNSLKVCERDTGILYYDCTNYFFEIEEASGLKQYGISKEHRPNPIVQMGLFMDGAGIPLAFSINSGNTNEQTTLKPLEERILSDFKMSKFVVCTDAGLASTANRKFNDRAGRAFITTQSVKQLKSHIKAWALDSKGWHITGAPNVYDISDLGEEHHETIFYKERWVNENGLEQKLIVTYSLKYWKYQRMVRQSQIERAVKLIDTGPKRLKAHNQNDYRRFVIQTHSTVDGEVAKNQAYSIDTLQIAKEETYDGFYAVCTNLDDTPETIIGINKRRWEIEESFRIMKSEFKARPVHLSRDDRISAHFMTCFLALIIYRLLEKKLGDLYCGSELVRTLRDMNFYNIPGEGYIPTYKRTDLTDALHSAAGFRTDYEIVSSKNLKNIFKLSKQQ